MAWERLERYKFSFDPRVFVLDVEVINTSPWNTEVISVLAFIPSSFRKSARPCPYSTPYTRKFEHRRGFIAHNILIGLASLNQLDWNPEYSSQTPMLRALKIHFKRYRRRFIGSTLWLADFVTCQDVLADKDCIFQFGYR